MGYLTKMSRFIALDVVNRDLVQTRLAAFQEADHDHPEELIEFVEEIVRIHLCTAKDPTYEQITAYNHIYSTNSRGPNNTKLKELTNPLHKKALPIAISIICPGKEHASHIGF